MFTFSNCLTQSFIIKRYNFKMNFSIHLLIVLISDNYILFSYIFLISDTQRITFVINSDIMAKEKERKLARILYVEQNKDAKEISQLINVSEVTLSKWVNLYAWKDLRSAKNSNQTNRTQNIRQIINDISEQRIAEGRALMEAESNADMELCQAIRTRIAKLDDAVSKWNKTLENIDKENQISLSVYVNVMEMVFNALKSYDEKLYLQTLDFQDAHLNDVSLKFK